ncbi:hypothetical protein GCM10007425_11570 [Lysinibacillus alkalisoli]|uniref:HTH cro/C1-type domain-containing protein n=1 Tax=Lysinibacillus alkalisoli TaxID=1911548 RepID=A0A917G1T9_9BACI|nr:helix-turn-helix transcriptional regulator [Lysinibacillus alkalisoli]GGG18764.1 hypothetical protein GCM10007425_11570 [Lysinibacillus alkalisoli]
MFTATLKKQRLKLNLSQQEVALKIGIDRSYYCKIENGLRPSVKVAQKIGKLLQVDWYIFFE